MKLYIQLLIVISRTARKSSTIIVYDMPKIESTNKSDNRT